MVPDLPETCSLHPILRTFSQSTLARPASIFYPWSPANLLSGDKRLLYRGLAKRDSEGITEAWLDSHNSQVARWLALLPS